MLRNTIAPESVLLFTFAVADRRLSPSRGQERFSKYPGQTFCLLWHVLHPGKLLSHAILRPMDVSFVHAESDVKCLWKPVITSRGPPTSAVQTRLLSSRKRGLDPGTYLHCEKSDGILEQEWHKSDGIGRSLLGRLPARRKFLSIEGTEEVEVV